MTTAQVIDINITAPWSMDFYLSPINSCFFGFNFRTAFPNRADTSQVQVELSGVEMQVAVDLHPMEVMDRIAPKLEVEVSVGKHKKIYPSNNSENADHESASTMIGPTLEVPTLKDQFHAAMQQLLEDETLKSWIENS